MRQIFASNLKRPLDFMCLHANNRVVDSQKGAKEPRSAFIMCVRLPLLKAPQSLPIKKKREEMKQSHRSQTASTVGVIKENLFTLNFLLSSFSFLPSAQPRSCEEKCVEHFNFAILFHCCLSSASCSMIFMVVQWSSEKCGFLSETCNFWDKK